MGELIAVTPDSLWVLSPGGGDIVALPDLVGGQMVGWNSQYGNVGAAAILGTLSTISNGWFLFLTAPMWVVGGSLAAASQSRHPIIRALPPRWMELRRFARFPQGLPPGIDFRELRLKR